MQYLQYLLAVLLHALLTEALDGSEGRERLRSPAGEIHGLTVVAQHIRRNAFPPCGIPPPLEDPVVSHPAHFVEFSEQLLQRRNSFLAPPPLSSIPHLRALQSPGLKEDTPVRSTAIDEELRFRPNHLTLSEILPQHAVVEHPGRLIPPHRHDSRLD
jgi:hypothetical protein